MNNRLITGLLAILILGFFLTSGCTSTEPAGTPPVTTGIPVSPTGPVLKTIIVSDNLSQWKADWEPEYDSSDGKIFYSGGSLHIRDNMPPNGSMYQTLNLNFTDFILDVDTRLINGTADNWQGVFIRMQDEDNNYNLAVSGDGYYTIVKTRNGNVNSLMGEPSSSGFINTGIGAVNHIHIEAIKNSLSLSVNGHQLRTVTDNTFTGGTVALSANCLTPDSFTEIGFNNLVISQA